MFVGRKSALARLRALIVAVAVVGAGCENPVRPDNPGGTGGGSPTPAPPRPVFSGCYAAGAQASGLGCGIRSTLGDPSADAAFASEVGYQRGFWQGIPAAVAVFDECRMENRNAVALPDGSILYGYYLFTSLYTQYRNGLPIAGVLAHEWAHQVQFRFGWQNPNAPTVRGTELEADAFAGYYMALAKGWAWSFIGSYWQAVFNSGDYNFNSRGHHGTPEQRLAAARMGFEAGLYAITYNRPFTYYELHTVFAQAIGSGFSHQRFSAQAAASTAPRELADALLRGEAWDIARGNTKGSELSLPAIGHVNREALFPR
jgi:hypothetical protein